MIRRFAFWNWSAFFVTTIAVAITDWPTDLIPLGIQGGFVAGLVVGRHVVKP